MECDETGRDELVCRKRKAIARLLKPLNFSKIKGLTVALFFFVLSSSEKMSLAGTCCCACLVTH